MAYRFAVLFVLGSLIVQVNSQICQGLSQYGRCSSNTACGCLHMPGAPDIGICGFQWVTCSDLVPCTTTDSSCSQPDHICVHHPRCNSAPVCYPSSMMDRKICPSMTDMSGTSTAAILTTSTTPKPAFVPLRASVVDIQPNAKWEQNGIIVTAGTGNMNATDEIHSPMGLFVTNEQTVYITDPNRQRIVQVMKGSLSISVAAGGNGYGNEAYQLSGPSDVIVDKETDSLIICDNSNKRVVRWPRVTGTRGQTIISNVSCHGLTMDEYGSIYLVGYDTHEVRRYKKGETQPTIVAGGNGRGSQLNQLNWPQYIFVDRDLSVYVSEWYNDRVTKWVNGAKEGVVVAGGQGRGNALTQLGAPGGIVVDQLGTLYISDSLNDRVMRWPKGAKQGTVIIGGNGKGNQPNQLNHPTGLSFDQAGNLYVVEHWNNRVQKFNIVSNV